MRRLAGERSLSNVRSTLGEDFTVGKSTANAVRNGYDLEAVVVPGAGPVLRECREKQSITQDEMAVRTGLHKSAISRYENGVVAVNLLVLESLANAINVRPETIIAKCQAKLLKKVTARYKGTTVEGLVDDIRDFLIET